MGFPVLSISLISIQLEVLLYFFQSPQLFFSTKPSSCVKVFDEK